MDVYIGFDSAWTDKQDAPGAICAVAIHEGQPVRFHAPELATFAQALNFIDRVASKTGVTLIALDQPTIVPNMTSLRPVERVASSLVSWLGGGVQPSNRSKKGMFCDASPIWPFLNSLGASEKPEEARIAPSGRHVIEVFPAMALASLNDNEFFGRLKAPKYNPDRRKTFRSADWERVAECARKTALSFACHELADWCRRSGKIDRPRKADQDRLDSALCLLIALHWRLRPRQESIMLGDLTTGYIVLPASPEVKHRLIGRAAEVSVAAV